MVKKNIVTVDYCKSARCECKSCKSNIVKEEVRIGAKDVSEGQAWYHVHCFNAVRDHHGFPANSVMTNLSGWSDIEPEDQLRITNMLGPKIENPNKPVDSAEGTVEAPIKSKRGGRAKPAVAADNEKVEAVAEAPRRGGRRGKATVPEPEKELEEETAKPAGRNRGATVKKNTAKKTNEVEVSEEPVQSSKARGRGAKKTEVVVAEPEPDDMLNGADLFPATHEEQKEEEEEEKPVEKNQRNPMVVPQAITDKGETEVADQEQEQEQEQEPTNLEELPKEVVEEPFQVPKGRGRAAKKHDAKVVETEPEEVTGEDVAIPADEEEKPAERNKRNAKVASKGKKQETQTNEIPTEEERTKAAGKGRGRATSKKQVEEEVEEPSPPKVEKKVTKGRGKAADDEEPVEQPLQQPAVSVDEPTLSSSEKSPKKNSNAKNEELEVERSASPEVPEPLIGKEDASKRPKKAPKKANDKVVETEEDVMSAPKVSPSKVAKNSRNASPVKSPARNTESAPFEEEEKDDETVIDKKKGGKSKKNGKAQPTEEVFSEEKQEPLSKKSRAEVPESDSTPEEPVVTASPPANKGKKGRKVSAKESEVTSDIIPEVPAEVAMTEEPSVKKAKGKTAAKDPEPITDNTEAEAEPVAPKRAGRGARKQTAENASTVSAEEATVASTRPTRGGRAKAAAKQVLANHQTTESTD